MMDWRIIKFVNEAQLISKSFVSFLIANASRFTPKGILVLYMSQKLLMDKDTATLVYHANQMMIYFACIFGAILSDTWLGRYKTILVLSIVYAIGGAVIALSATPYNPLSADIALYAGLALVSIGAGGIKPCVAAFGGDQFKLPEQAAQVATFFSIFYFTISAGSLLSTTITPILREDVHCFGEADCYALAFGVPAILMVIAVGKIAVDRSYGRSNADLDGCVDS